MNQPEPICIDLTDGTHFQAMIHVEAGKLHINAGWGMSFVVVPESAYQVCTKILELLNAQKSRS